MPNIAQHHSSEVTKLLLIGDSGSGKTGALASLASEGYNLRILDTDNGLDILKNYLTDPTSPYVKKDPSVADRVSFITLTEEMKNVGGELVPARATVWQATSKLLNDWQDGEVGLGKITTWTGKDILVIDSLSSLSKAALNFILAINGKLLTPGSVTQNEGRRNIGAAQEKVRSLLEMLYDKSVKCNVIITAHVTFINDAGVKPGVNEKGELIGTPQGYPSSIGRALSPHIPRWFNNMLILKASGSGAGTRHKLYTRSQPLGDQIINAKSSAPLKVAPEYGIEWGLAEYFKAVRS